jgi:hypothetical protein
MGFYGLLYRQMHPMEGRGVSGAGFSIPPGTVHYVESTIEDHTPISLLAL